MSPKQAKPQPHQKLWVVRYGTMSQMVWAGSADYAELKVRTGKLSNGVTVYAVGAAPIILEGEMFVKEATEADIREWSEAGGRAVEWMA